MSLLPQETTVQLPEYKQAIQIMRQNNKMSLEDRKDIFKTNYSIFWRTKELAQEICDYLGIEAWDWFVQSYKEQLMIKELDDTWKNMLAPYEYTHHDDGRITIK